MEVITVSPVSTSLAKGPSLCEIDVTNMAIHCVMRLLCLCGLLGNGAVLWLLHSRRMRRHPISVYIFHQASTDFLFLTLVPSTLDYVREDMSISHDLNQNYLLMVMPQSLFYYNMGLCLLTAISIERCSSILCPLWCHCHCPQHLSEVVDALLMAIIVAFIVTLNHLCLLHEHKNEHFQVSLISTYTLNLILFAFSMVISSIILFIKVKCGSQQLQPSRLDIIIFLMALFCLPFSLCNFLQQLGYTCVSSRIVLLLACINSTLKPFICFLVGRCWKHCSVGSLQLSLQRIFEEPEENTSSSSDGHGGLSLLIPSTALLKESRKVAEGSFEPPD